VRIPAVWVFYIISKLKASVSARKYFYKNENPAVGDFVKKWEKTETGD
jgi:hypothetical protein